MRHKLGLKTEKRHGSYEIAAGETPKLRLLFEKYGIEAESGDVGDMGDVRRTDSPDRDAADAGS